MEETGESIEVKEEVMGVENVDDENNIKEEENSVVGTKEIKDVILKILESEGAHVSFEDCTTEEERLNKCLLLVDKRLKVKQEATNLVNMLKDLKLVEGMGEVDEKVVEVKDEEAGGLGSYPAKPGEQVDFQPIPAPSAPPL